MISARHSVDEDVLDNLAAVWRHADTPSRKCAEKFGNILQRERHFGFHIATLVETSIPLVFKELRGAFDYTADYLLDPWGIQ
jgi:hypothetical protein